MNTFFIKKILPIISGLFLLASLFLFFKMKKNTAIIELENTIINHYENTNAIIKEANNLDYEMMKEATYMRPDDSSLTESIEKVFSITKAIKIALKALFEINKTENEQINLAIDNYKTNIHTLLDSFERVNAIVTKEDVNNLKAAMFCESMSTSLTGLQKNAILNHLNINSMQLTRFFSSKLGCGGLLIFDRFQPMISLSSVTPNSQIFKIFVSHPKAFSIENLEMFYNNQSIPKVDGERVIQISAKDNATQTAIISANWTNPPYSSSDIPSNTSISDTFTLTSFN